MDVKNVVVVYDYAYINGGAAKVAIQSAVGLKHRGLNVCYYAAVGPVCETLTINNVPVRCLNIQDINNGKRLSGMVNGIWNRGVKKDFEDYLDTFDQSETIIHIHGWSKALSASVVAAARKKGYRSIITLHDYFTLCPNGGFYNYKKKRICHYRHLCVGCMLTNCDKRNYIQKIWRSFRQLVQDRVVRDNDKVAYITISEKNEQIMRGHTKSDHYFRVINPVQLSNAYVEDIQNKKNFLYIGRISEEKGADLFCQAVSIMKAKDEDITGTLVGDGPIYKDLKERYPEINFTGWVSPEDVQRYILHARALVFPSIWYEGAPLTIIEAMSAGLPCIVSDCTSATEVVCPGVNGLVFKSGDVSELIECMYEILDDEMISDLQNNILKSFSREMYSSTIHTDNLIKVYREWLNE